MSGNEDVLLRADGLSVGYGARSVASGLIVRLRAGEMACLLGPNGAGKSTLLRTLIGMQPALAGEVHIGALSTRRANPRDLATRVAVVLTERLDQTGLTAYDLAALGRYPHTDWRGGLSAHDHDQVRAALEAVGATALVGRRIDQLSDGERQRVLIARALAQDTPLIVLDEPTAFLDLPRRIEILSLLRALTRQTRRAVLLSTHDLDLALRLADSLWLLGADGRFQHGPPEMLALNGGIASVFHGAGLSFDLNSGAFKFQTGAGAPALLRGDGPAATWTARALERIGYAVTRASDGEYALSSGLTIDVYDAPTRWHARRGQINIDCASLDELIQFLS